MMNKDNEPNWSPLDNLPKVEHVECVLLNEEGTRISQGYFFSVSDPDRYHFHPTDNASKEVIATAKKLKAYPGGTFGKPVIYTISSSEVCTGNLNLHWHMTLTVE